MLPPTNFCLDCQRYIDITLDYRAGYTICSECGGLLPEFNRIDETPEWQNLDDPIEKPTEMIVRTSNKGLKLIGTMADRLGLSTEIKDRAGEIYNKVDVLKTCKGRSMNSILAACLFIACREIRLSRTLKEVSAVADFVSKKDINRAIEAIKKQLEVETRTVQAGELVRRFCSKLGMENQAIEAVQEAVDKTQELDIRSRPKSVLAAIIYMVIQLSDDIQVPVKDIALAAEVTELTIRKSYKDISLNASRLIPDWFASDEDIKKIPTP
ncbi:hypothetical protein DITRI_Ditri09bG0055200 [Diplodiscus trichospermus]